MRPASKYSLAQNSKVSEYEVSSVGCILATYWIENARSCLRKSCLEGKKSCL